MILENHFKFIVFMLCNSARYSTRRIQCNHFQKFSRQIAFADIIIVNKTDLVTEDSLLELKSRIT